VFKKDCAWQRFANAMSGLPSTKLEMMAEVLGTRRMEARYWSPLPEYASMKWWLGRPPPLGHIWWRCPVQMMLGIPECERLGLSPFQLRRLYKPAGARSKPRVSFLQTVYLC
jgi:hypothetical protein